MRMEEEVELVQDQTDSIQVEEDEELIQVSNGYNKTPGMIQSDVTPLNIDSNKHLYCPLRSTSHSSESESNLKQSTSSSETIPQECNQHTKRHLNSKESSSQSLSPALIPTTVTIDNINEFDQNRWIIKSLDVPKKRQRGSKFRQLSQFPIAYKIPKQLNEHPMFYIVGNVIVDFGKLTVGSWDVARKAGNEEEDYPILSLYNYFKEVTQFEDKNCKGELTLSFSVIVKPIEEFSFLQSYLLGLSGSPIAKEIARLLNLYQNSGAREQRSALKCMLMKFEEQCADIPALMSRRSEVLRMHQDELLKKYNCFESDSFYVCQHYTADFTSFEHNLSKISYSYALLALLGVSPQQFGNVIRHKGVATWVSPYSRSLMLIELLRDLTGEDLSNERESALDPFRLKTVDDIVVTTKGKRICRRVKKEEYFGDVAKDSMDDFVFLMIFDIDMFTIKRIIGSRENVNLNEIASHFTECIETTVMQEIFLESYYSNLLEKNRQMVNQPFQQVNQQQQSRVFQQWQTSHPTSAKKTCGYRQIAQ